MNAIFTAAHSALKEAEAEAIRLNAVASQVEGLEAKLKQLRSNEAELNAELASLATSVSEHRKAVEDAKKEAEQHVHEGRNEASRLVGAANVESMRLVKSAREQSDALLSDARLQVNHIHKQRDDAAAELKEIQNRTHNARSQFVTLHKAAKAFADNSKFVED